MLSVIVDGIVGFGLIVLAVVLVLLVVFLATSDFVLWSKWTLGPILVLVALGVMGFGGTIVNSPHPVLIRPRKDS